MIPELQNQSCVPCKGDTPALSKDEISNLQPQVPDWEIETVDNIPHIRRSFQFSDYMQGVSFAEKVGEMAEMHDHHPRIVIDWRKVTVEWWTHTIKGLHNNDFVMAAKTDTIYAGWPGVSPDEANKVNQRRTRDVVQRASEDSFPASDPPAWQERREEA